MIRAREGNSKTLTKSTSSVDRPTTHPVITLLHPLKTKHQGKPQFKAYWSAKRNEIHKYLLHFRKTNTKVLQQRQIKNHYVQSPNWISNDINKGLLFHVESCYRNPKWNKTVAITVNEANRCMLSAISTHSALCLSSIFKYFYPTYGTLMHFFVEVASTPLVVLNQVAVRVNVGNSAIYDFIWKWSQTIFLLGIGVSFSM